MSLRPELPRPAVYVNLLFNMFLYFHYFTIRDCQGTRRNSFWSPLPPQKLTGWCTKMYLTNNRTEYTSPVNLQKRCIESPLPVDYH